MNDVKDPLADIHPALPAQHAQQAGEGKAEDQRDMGGEVVVLEELQGQQAQGDDDRQYRQSERRQGARPGVLNGCIRQAVAPLVRSLRLTL